jgi:hypothetical protein
VIERYRTILEGARYVRDLSNAWSGFAGIAIACGDTRLVDPLEGRGFLAAHDPVIVLTEATGLAASGPVTPATVSPWLWRNPGEHPYTLGGSDYGTIDADGNGYIGDVYGYNFLDNSPNIIDNSNHHGRYIMSNVLSALNEAGTPATVRTRIMHVLGTGSQVAQSTSPPTRRARSPARRLIPPACWSNTLTTATRN